MTLNTDMPKTRKPRLVVAGEFSAGKTRLITGLIGADVLPSNVTATALPAVWLVQGPHRMAAVDLTGATRDIDTLDGISVDDTHYVVISHPSEILENFDIIDTPGSSDPNIPNTCWERVLGFADIALWCTNATQAWRQSEKSVWEDMPAHLRGSAMLLVTHADRMPDDRMANRVLRRVQREAREYFASYDMASLIRSTDVARIRSMVSETVGALPNLAGAENPVLSQLIDQWSNNPGSTAATTPIAPKAPIAMPRRVQRKTPQQSETVMSQTTVSGEPANSDIVVLKQAPKAQEPSPAAAPERASKPAPQSLLRAAWAEMYEDFEPNDEASLLACVNEFLSLLERHGDRYLPPKAASTHPATANAAGGPNVSGSQT